MDFLESEDEDLNEQDQFKGMNLNQVKRIHKRYETRAERIAWLSNEGNDGKYAIAMAKKPKDGLVQKKHREHQQRVARLQQETKLNEP